MKRNLLNILTAVFLLLSAPMAFAANPSLGVAADFVLYSTDGALNNVGITHLTGKVGTNNGSITGFGNVNGGMHNSDGVTAAAAGDLLIAYNLLNSAIAEYFPAPLLGNGQILVPGIYSIGESATLNNVLILDGQNNPNAEFIIKIQGSFSTASLSEVKLINGATACKVFWKVEGLVSMASGTIMKGNMVVNNAAVVMEAGVELEGRALTTAGAITVDGVLAYTPIGCGSPVLTGPAAPDLKSTSCFAVFSSNGSVTNSGVTVLKGDVGTNVGLTTGFDPLTIDGNLYAIPVVATAAAAADLTVVFNYLNLLSADIELLYPAQFGNNLVLTPHTYLLNAATSLTDTLYLNALGKEDAVFVIKINGAMTTSTYAKVVLMNGAKAENIYWLVSGALEINDYSIIQGTIVVNNGAINLKTGTTLNGRALTNTGEVNTMAVIVERPSPCFDYTTSVDGANDSERAIVYYHANMQSIVLSINGVEADKVDIYSITGSRVMSASVHSGSNTFSVNVPAGIYFYKLSELDQTVQTGKLIIQ